MTEIKNTKIKRVTKPVFTLHAASGSNKGEIELLWQPVNNALSYIVQVNRFANSEKTWKHIDIVTRTKYTVTGLKSGRFYSFRIAPITERGQKEWSKYITEKAA